MTKLLINLYAGPGAGKSTTAAAWYTYLKQQEHSAELVREWVKQWAYEKREITPVDQIFITANTINDHLQAMRAGIPILISDSPVPSGMFYVQEGSTRSSVISACEAFSEEAENLGYRVINVHLRRSLTRKYNTEGRWQTEEEAKQIDLAIENTIHKQRNSSFNVDYENAVNLNWQQNFFGRILND